MKINYDDIRREIEMTILSRKQKAKSEYDLAYQALESVEKELIAYVDKLEKQEDEEVERMIHYIEQSDARRREEEEFYHQFMEFGNIGEQLKNLNIRK